MNWAYRMMLAVNHQNGWAPPNAPHRLYWYNWRTLAFWP